MQPGDLIIFAEKSQKIIKKNIDFFILLRYTYSNKPTRGCVGPIGG